MASVAVVALPFKAVVPKPKPVNVEAIVRQATWEGYYKTVGDDRMYWQYMAAQQRYGFDIKTIRGLTMRQLSYLNGNPQSQKASS